MCFPAACSQSVSVLLGSDLAVPLAQAARLYVGQGAFVDADNIRFLAVPDPITGATLIRTAVADRHSTATGQRLSHSSMSAGICFCKQR